MSSLTFTHNNSNKLEDPDIDIQWDAALNLYQISVTLSATASATGQLYMWYNDPCTAIFNPNNPYPLIPAIGIGNVGASESSPPSNVTQWLNATPTQPAVFTLGWTVPNNLASDSVGLFFQAVDQSDPNAPRTWQPTAKLNAQYNLTVV